MKDKNEQLLEEVPIWLIEAWEKKNLSGERLADIYVSGKDAEKQKKRSGIAMFSIVVTLCLISAVTAVYYSVFRNNPNHEWMPLAFFTMLIFGSIVNALFFVYAFNIRLKISGRCTKYRAIFAKFREDIVGLDAQYGDKIECRRLSQSAIEDRLTSRAACVLIVEKAIEMSRPLDSKVSLETLYEKLAIRNDEKNKLDALWKTVQESFGLFLDQKIGDFYAKAEKQLKSNKR